VAARLVEDHGYEDRDHSGPGVRDPVRASGGVHLYRRHQGRDLNDDRRAGHRGFTCAEIGKRIPILRNIGSAAIFATSFLGACPTS
jgi:hypothetical protein